MCFLCTMSAGMRNESVILSERGEVKDLLYRSNISGSHFA